MRVVGVVSWIATGVLWIATGVVYRFGPAYSHPATLIEYLAISLFSGGLLATAVGLWTLREMTRDRVGGFGASAAIVGAAGGGLAGLADIGEDALRLPPSAACSSSGWWHWRSVRSPSGLRSPQSMGGGEPLRYLRS